VGPITYGKNPVCYIKSRISYEKSPVKRDLLFERIEPAIQFESRTHLNRDRRRVPTKPFTCEKRHITSEKSPIFQGKIPVKGDVFFEGIEATAHLKGHIHSKRDL